MKLSPEQLARYNRNILIKEIGSDGQQKLLASKVLIIGLGGLGSAAAYALAGAGVGTLGLVDYDCVEISNLQRQIIHNTLDLGKLKVISAQEKINYLNPHLEVKTYPVKIHAKNIQGLIRGYDFILDCTDNFTAKFLINDACVKSKKPYSHCGVLALAGQMMTIIPGHACYRCVFGAAPQKNKVKAGLLVVRLTG